MRAWIVEQVLAHYGESRGVILTTNLISCRDPPFGYRITVVKVDSNRKAYEYSPFAVGWLDGRQVLGRPVDLVVTPDGSLLVSDDKLGVIYRITYTGN